MALKVDPLSDTIYRAYDSAKYFNRQAHIFRKDGGSEFIKKCIVSDLKEFYKHGVKMPQKAIRTENEARFSVSLPRKIKPTFKERMKNRYLNMLMDLRIKLAIQSDSELRSLKAKFDKLV